MPHYGAFHLGLHCLKYTKGSDSMNIFRRSIISETLGVNVNVFCKTTNDITCTLLIAILQINCL